MEISTPIIPIPEAPKPKRTKILAIVLLLVGLVIGASIGYGVTYMDFNGKLNNIRAGFQSFQYSPVEVSSSNTTFILGYNASLATLYQQVKSSVVIIQDLAPQNSFFGNLMSYSQQQGSGFVTLVDNKPVIITNNHVVAGAINHTVTFANGDTYPAKVLGSDPLADLAVLSVASVPSGVTPLALSSSKNLQVGQPVVAVGSPYGLSGTLTTGIISALGRVITEGDESGDRGDLMIPDVIQTSTAINPGNSGGPLLDYTGNVVGVTTAGLSNSQALGFAIPSDTIRRELNSLVNTGTYDGHPSLEISGRDMTYQIAQVTGLDVTYGFLVESASQQSGLKGGTTQTSILGSKVITGGDVIVAVNGVRITNSDDLLSYLERNTQPNQTVSFTVVRNQQIQTVPVVISRQ